MQMAHQLHASEGGMYMDKEDTLSAMKDGVSFPKHKMINWPLNFSDHYHLD